MNALLRTGAIAALLPWTIAHASIPGHEAVDRLIYCEWAKPGDACRIDVPNGDFSGPPGDSASHGSFLPRLGEGHSVAAHIVPWRYIDPGRRGGGELISDGKFTLLQLGDRIEQRLSLPPVPADTGVIYAVHAHTATYSGYNRVRMDLTLRDGDRDLGRANAAVIVNEQQSRQPAELVAWIEVPAGTRPTGIDIAISSEDGYGRVPVADVFVVRAHPDDTLPELPPRW